MLKRLGWSLLLGTALCAPAQAEPVSTFFIGVAAGLAGTAGTGIYLGALGAGVAAGQFLAANIGTIILAGVSLAFSALNSRRRPEESQVNVRLAAGPRWHLAGDMKAGGTAAFGAFDSAGAFWYLIIHTDSELMALDHYRLDDIEVTLSGNKVTNSEFRAELEGFLGLFPGDTKGFFSIWSTTYDPDDPVPPAITAFKSAFPEWTDDHLLVGTTYSVVKIDAVDDKAKPLVYRWRGAFQIGEPSLTLIGRWGRIYDPRDVGQDIDDPATWGSSRNAALIWAWNRYRSFGFNQPMDSINWTEVAAEADICDQVVTDKDGNDAPRYAVGVAFSEDMANIECEQQILAACDGIVMFDSAGKAFMRVGHWAAPTLTLTADRDVMAMASREAEDGESETDGVVVTYTDPDLGYVPQPCAPWLNPDFYDSSRTPSYIQISIPAIQNHNQAVRVAKAIGKRSQALHRLAPTIGLRVLKCRRERVITLDYDATFGGAYQIAGPVEVDQSGMFGVLALVPIDANNWTLLPGEEGDKPTSEVIDQTAAIPAAAGVIVSAVPIVTESGNAVRLEITYDEPISPIYSYQFYYSSDYTGDPDTATWLGMVNDAQNHLAYSPPVSDGETYYVRYRTKTLGGSYGTFSAPSSIVAIADTVPPGVVTGVSGTGGVGIVDIDWTAPASANYAKTVIHRNTVNDDTTATQVHVEPGAIGVADTWQDSGLAAGTYYYWLYAANGSSVVAAAVATGAVVVT